MDVKELLRKPCPYIATTYRQQIDLLKDQALKIEDCECAERSLQKISYHRFRKYSKQWLTEADCKYDPSVSFNKIVSIYEFDCELRQVLFYLLSKVEVSLRAAIANEFAHAYSPMGYLDSRNFNDQELHHIFLDEVEKEQSRTYEKLDTFSDSLVPIWAILEITNFSTLSYFYKNINSSLQLKIAREYFGMPNRYVGEPAEITMQKWLHCLSVIRNICAHNGKLYNRNLVVSPKLNYRLDVFGFIPRNKVFAIIMVMKELTDQQSWEKFKQSLCTIIGRYTSVIDLDHLGMPLRWTEVLDI